MSTVRWTVQARSDPPSGGLAGPGPTVVAATQRRRRRIAKRCHTHAPLAGAANLSELGWSVDPPKPSALVSSQACPDAMAVRVPLKV